MNNKKLYFKFSNGDNASEIVMTLDGVLAWIEGDELDKKDASELELYEYTLQPVLMTDEEYDNLPEASF